MLKVILVANRAVLLRARRHAADYTIKMVADSAVRSAKANFLALMALRLEHLFV